MHPRCNLSKRIHTHNPLIYNCLLNISVTMQPFIEIHHSLPYQYKTVHITLQYQHFHSAIPTLLQCNTNAFTVQYQRFHTAILPFLRQHNKALPHFFLLKTYISKLLQQSCIFIHASVGCHFLIQRQRICPGRRWQAIENKFRMRC